MTDQDLTFALDVAKHRLRIRDKIKDAVSDAFLLAAKFVTTSEEMYDLADLTEFALGVLDGKVPKIPKRDLLNIVSRIAALNFGRGGKPMSPTVLAIVEAKLRGAA